MHVSCVLRNNVYIVSLCSSNSIRIPVILLRLNVSRFDTLLYDYEIKELFREVLFFFTKTDYGLKQFQNDLQVLLLSNVQQSCQVPSFPL